MRKELKGTSNFKEGKIIKDRKVLEEKEARESYQWVTVESKSRRLPHVASQKAVVRRCRLFWLLGFSNSHAGDDNGQYQQTSTSSPNQAGAATHQITHWKADSTSKISILGAVDTCTQCSVRCAQFHAPLIQALPNLVCSITKAEDKFTPLKLSGINSNKEETDQKAIRETSKMFMTELPILVEYFLPFSPKNSTVDLGFTFKVVLGIEVAINTIIRLPFLYNTDSIINLKENIMSSNNLNCVLFILECKIPSLKYPPNFDAIKKSVGNSPEMVNLNIINQIPSQQYLETDISQTTMDWNNDLIMGEKESTYVQLSPYKRESMPSMSCCPLYLMSSFACNILQTMVSTPHTVPKETPYLPFLSTKTI